MTRGGVHPIQDRRSLRTALSFISLPGGKRRVTDRRYRTKRWQRVRLRVLARDAWRCRVVADCPKPATVADHIIPVYDGMPDALFFGLGNLRAACRNHNLARGLTEHLQTASTASTSVVTTDYSKDGDGPA